MFTGARATVSLTLLLGGCVATGPVGEAQSALRDPVDGEETQGTSLVGAQLEGVWQVNYPKGVVIEHGALIGTTPVRGPKDLVGQLFVAEIAGKGTVRLQIAAAVQATASLPGPDDYLRSMDPSGSSWLYTVATVDGVPLCNKDRFGSRQAVAVDGWWDAKGAWHAGQERVFTFGCLAGVIAKCYKWSYLPWLPVAPGAQPMTDVHWACTRAARADYCGDGVSHTEDNTPVDVWDDVRPVHRRVEDATAPPPPDLPVKFEAAWGTLGALCITHPRWASMPPTLCDDETSVLFGTKKRDSEAPPQFCDSPAAAERLAASLLAASSPRGELVPVFIASDDNVLP